MYSINLQCSNKVLKTLFYIIVLSSIYFVMLRPVRVYFVQNIIFQELSKTYNSNVQLYNAHPSNPAFYVILPNINGPYQRNDVDRNLRLQLNQSSISEKNIFNYTGFGDKFFLFGSIYLICIGLGWKYVYQLFILHQLISLLSLTFLILTFAYSTMWLYPMNLLVTYITPAATGMFVLTWGKRLNSLADAR